MQQLLKETKKNEIERIQRQTLKVWASKVSEVI